MRPLALDVRRPGAGQDETWRPELRPALTTPEVLTTSGLGCGLEGRGEVRHGRVLWLNRAVELFPARSKAVPLAEAT